MLLFRSDDRGDHFRMMTKNPAVVGRGLYYSHLTIDPTDENRIYSIRHTLSGDHLGRRSPSAGVAARPFHSAPAPLQTFRFAEPLAFL